MRPDSAAADPPPDVSVVIPCYEQGTFLVEAVASVERCAPPRCELIVVNDGSREPRTLEILDGLKRSGYFVHDQENRGLAGARDAGIELARGRYVLPLDADNRLRDHYVQDAIRVLDAEPGVGVVYGDRHEFGLPRPHQDIPDFDLKSLLQRNYIDACAVLRKQVWVDCRGYDAAIYGMEDWDLWIHAAERGWRFHHLPYLAFDYRVRPDSLLSRALETLDEIRRRLRAKYFELYWNAAQDDVLALTRRLAEQAAAHEQRLQAQALAHEQQLRVQAAEITAALNEVGALRDELARHTATIERMQRGWSGRLLRLGRALDGA
jgi:glycosyltransferase involved in cell wall biosynthesis